MYVYVCVYMCLYKTIIHTHITISPMHMCMYVYVCVCMHVYILCISCAYRAYRAHFLQAKVLVGRYSTDTGNTYNIQNI